MININYTEEILFKAKTKDGGKWIEGYLFKIWDKSYILWGTTNGIPNMTEVIPETVCQYIFRSDINGKKIFTDDIVLTQKFEQKVECVVEFEIGFVATYKKDGIKYYTNIMADSNAFEIIGNIHD